MSKVKTPSRPRIRELKHQMLIKDINRKKNLDGCNARIAK